MFCCTSFGICSVIVLFLNVYNVLAAPAQHFRSQNFTAAVMSVTRTGPTAPGYLFLTPGFAGSIDAPTMMDDSGELIWRSGNNWEASNFNTQEFFGQPVLLFWTGTRDRDIGTGYGGVHMLNSSYDQIHFICASGLDIKPLFELTNTTCKIDPHESRLTARGTIIFSARSVVQADLSSVGGPENGYVLDNIFYELDVFTEAVKTRWSAYEHRHDYAAFTSTKLPLHHGTGIRWGASPDAPWDFFHMDSIIDVQSVRAGVPNGFLVSSRYIAAVIKVSNEGETEWYFTGDGKGDFALPASAHFSFQHDVGSMNVTTTSMRVTMFDNANYAPTQPRRPSSALVLELDLVKKEISLVHRFFANDFTASIKMGSYQPLPYHGHSLVDFGIPAKIFEYDENGQIVWEGVVGGPTTTLYRVSKKPWVGTPSSVPSVFAEHDGTDTAVWISWNGDTEVQDWEVYGRQTETDAMKLLAKVPRSGFETMATGKGRMVEVFALGRRGERTLGSSNFTRVRKNTTPIVNPPTGVHSGQQTSGPHHHGVGVGLLESTRRALLLEFPLVALLGFLMMI